MTRRVGEGRSVQAATVVTAVLGLACAWLAGRPDAASDWAFRMAGLWAGSTAAAAEAVQALGPAAALALLGLPYVLAALAVRAAWGKPVAGRIAERRRQGRVGLGMAACLAMALVVAGRGGMAALIGV